MTPSARARFPDPLRLIIFDNDGVLVDSEALSSTVLAETLSDLGVPTTAEECRRDFTGGTVGLVRTTIQARTGIALPESFEAVYARRLEDAFTRELAPSAGVVALLEDLDRRGITYCVASNGTRERIEVSLRAAGLLPRFADRVFSADQVARPKPAPDLFLHAAGTLGALASECLVIEDTPPGIAAARAAGMVVWATASTYPADELPGADRISASVWALGAALRDELGSSERKTSPEQESRRAADRQVDAPRGRP